MIAAFYDFYGKVAAHVHKASKSLRKDKKTCLSAIRKDTYTVMFMDEKLRNNDPDIRNAIINTEKYLIKYVDEYGELIEQYKNEIPSLGMVKEKDYLDNVLKSVDPVIDLDEDQRRVVLSDEDYTLVIAGAGAGKTTTVAAKVKYLVDKKDIDPKKILVISFTNKAVASVSLEPD